MIRKFLLLFLSLPFSVALRAQTGYTWHAPSFVEGICVQDTVHIFHRLPPDLEDKVRPVVWSLSLNTAGEYIDFTTNAKDIIVKYTLAGSLAMPHMPATGVSGVALWAMDQDGIWRWAPGHYHFGDTVTYTFRHLVFPETDSGSFRLYLPLYNTVNWLSIGVKEGNNFSFIPKRKEKPIVAYGTSILQGAVASRPDLAWTNIVERDLDRSIINLGFSGNGQIEAPIIDLMAGVDAEMYIIDCMPNLTRSSGIPAEEIRKRVHYAVTKLRERNKDVPILFAEHCDGYAPRYMDTMRANEYKQSSELMATLFHELETSGVKNIYLLTDTAINFDVNSTAEGLHPNDIGMMKYAEAYEKIIRRILHEPAGSVSTTVAVEQSRDSYNWMERHEAVLDIIRKDPPQVIIIGNSIVHYWGGKPLAKRVSGGLSWQKYLAPLGVQNLGFGWDRIENVLWRIYHGELDGYRARKILLMIGTNNLQISTDNDILAGYSAMIAAIRQRQPDAEIILSALLPRRGMEQRVFDLNDRMRKLAAEEHIRFVNTGNVLLNREKKINESLFIGDGLHPNERGYELIGKQLHEILK